MTEKLIFVISRNTQYAEFCFVKNMLGILFSILILATAFGDWIVFFSFKANQNFIAEYLCENKEKPELECNGKCFLSSILENQHGKDEDAPMPVLENKNPELFYVFQKRNVDFISADNAPKINFPPFSFLYFYQYEDGVFHPPKV